MFKTLFMANKLFAYPIIALFFMACLFGSCDKTPETQTLNFKFTAQAGGDDLVIGDTYSNSSGQRYKFITLLFYISHLQLLKDDGTLVPLSDVILYDMTHPTTTTIAIPSGKYTAIKFGLGLDAAQNATDPATIQPPNPLSYATAPYWGWAAKYIFAKLEGFVTADATATPNTPFLFHTGTDTLFREVSIARNFEIGDEALDLNIILNLDKLWSNPQAIDLINNGYTQTIDNFPDAEAFVNNFASAFE